jgi:hypothetical protein
MLTKRPQRLTIESLSMSEKKERSSFVSYGFTAQQFVLIAVTFLLGAASATAVNELFVEKSFGPASVVAAQDSQESR